MAEQKTYTYRVPVSVRAKQLPALLRRMIRHPAWALENGRLALRRRRDEARPFSLEPYMVHRVSEQEAFAALLGVEPDEFAAAQDISWWPASVRSGDRGDGFASWDGTPELLRVLSAAVRLTRPASVVEVGVARGMTSAVILAGMFENGRGRLYSLDLPALVVDVTTFVGMKVPADLRDRWVLEIGPSRLLLGPMLKRLGEIDIFVHDGDHTYMSQMEDFQLAWGALRPGGLLISDDVWCNASFFDFAARHGVRPYLVMGDRVETALGIVRRP